MSHFESSQRISMPVWALAAFGAIVIRVPLSHLPANTFMSMNLKRSWALAIEIGLEPLAPRLEPIDLPPGPDAEESIAAPPAVEQVRVEPTILLLAVPSETEDPELAVALVKKREPKEELSVLAPLPVSPAVPTEAAKATARPTS
jgi:hypothetical protein